ncbi:MAG TPA: PRC-barrel domain-containing protein [Hyphomicrobiaceae bacterium]
MKNIVALTAALSMLGATAAVSQTTNQMQQPQTPQVTPQQQTSPPVGVPPSPQAQTPQSKTTPMQQPSGQEAFLSQQQPDQMLATDLIGKSILGSNNARIGDINDLLISQNGEIVAALVGVGGFLGIGEKVVAIPYDSLNRSPQSDQITVSYSREDLEQAPQFVTAERARSGTGGTGTTGGGSAGGTQR